MSRPTLHTDRLELRPMTGEHLPHLIELDADPEVLQHIIGRARTEQEVREFWGPKAEDVTADAIGLGWWVGFVDGAFVGWWDLEPSGDDEAEAGWRLARSWWRQGLASEGAEALVGYAFEDLGLRLVWAETMAVNLGSRGVMRRLGMRHVRTEHRTWSDPLPGAELGEVVYELTREEWSERSLPRP